MSFPSAAILTSSHCVSARGMPPKSCDVVPWLPATAARLTSVRRGLAESSAYPLPPAPQAPPGGFPAGSAHGCVMKAMEGGVAVRGQPTSPEEELAALRLGRSIPVSCFINRHATMIEGRPVVALVLSHELANERDFDTYLVDMFRTGCSGTTAHCKATCSALLVEGPSYIKCRLACVWKVWKIH